MKIIGVCSICNFGGYEVAEDEQGNYFYRLNSGDRVTEWEELYIEQNPADDDAEWTYNPDVQAFLFPIAEVMRVA